MSHASLGPMLSPEVADYIEGLLPQRDPVLARMEAVAKERSIPIVGPVIGRLLYQFARSMGAKRIFEMGSAIGYSTIWLARALPPDGRIVYTDGNPHNADEATENLRQAGVLDRVDIKVGDALEILDGTSGTFDLIFNDVDKPWYPKVFDLAVPRVRPGGLFITDNAIWMSQVAGDDQSESTVAIRTFNTLCYESPELFTTIIPLRDGLTVCLKREPTERA